MHILPEVWYDSYYILILSLSNLGHGIGKYILISYIFFKSYRQILAGFDLSILILPSPQLETIPLCRPGRQAQLNLLTTLIGLGLSAFDVYTPQVGNLQGWILLITIWAKKFLDKFSS
jgi:hypothetical protein